MKRFPWLPLFRRRQRQPPTQQTQQTPSFVEQPSIPGTGQSSMIPWDFDCDAMEEAMEFVEESMDKVADDLNQKYTELQNYVSDTDYYERLVLEVYDSAIGQGTFSQNFLADMMRDSTLNDLVRSIRDLIETSGELEKTSQNLIVSYNSYCS